MSLATLLRDGNRYFPVLNVGTRSLWRVLRWNVFRPVPPYWFLHLYLHSTSLFKGKSSRCNNLLMIKVQNKPTYSLIILFWIIRSSNWLLWDSIDVATHCNLFISIDWMTNLTCESGVWSKGASKQPKQVLLKRGTNESTCQSEANQNIKGGAMTADIVYLCGHVRPVQVSKVVT